MVGLLFGSVRLVSSESLEVLFMFSTSPLTERRGSSFPRPCAMEHGSATAPAKKAARCAPRGQEDKSTRHRTHTAGILRYS